MIATTQGHKDARAYLDRFMALLTPAQINAAQRAALTWRPRAN